MQMWYCVRRVGPCTTSNRDNSAARKFLQVAALVLVPLCELTRYCGDRDMLLTVQELGRVDCESELRPQVDVDKAALFNVGIMWKGCQISWRT